MEDAMMDSLQYRPHTVHPVCVCHFIDAGTDGMIDEEFMVVSVVEPGCIRRECRSFMPMLVYVIL